MENFQIKKVLNMIEYENNRKELRREFLEHGVRFYDQYGWGYIKNHVKHYQEKN